MRTSYLADLSAVGAPLAIARAAIDKLLDATGQLRQIEKHMLRLTHHRRAAAPDVTARVLELERIQKHLTLVTLIALCVLVAALWTGSSHEPIRQVHITCLAVELLDRLFDQLLIGVAFREDVLRDGRLLLGGGAAKVIEADIEPLVDVGVNGVVFVAEL